MRKRITPCDGDDGICPFDAWYIEDCRVCCGLGVDEDEDEYIPSSENGDYSPSNPWDAPGDVNKGFHLNLDLVHELIMHQDVDLTTNKEE